MKVTLLVLATLLYLSHQSSAPVTCGGFDCATGYICIRDGCVKADPLGPCTNLKCLYGTVCRDGTCVMKNSCTGVLCGRNEACYEGECVAKNNSCVLANCSADQKCQNGKCVNREKGCFVDCRDGFKCVAD
jgi:hypothetical protein